jgi:antitoxin ParD1/3/4
MNKPSVDKRTFSLSEEQSEFIDAQVERGGYASASEVVRAGIRALQERDAVIEKWLREEVVPAYDAIVADPSTGIPAEDVMAEIRQLHAEMLKTRRA